MMKLKNKLGVVMLAAPLITGCVDNASDPDSGSSTNRVQVSGVAVDGYVAGARVYADLNNDGRRNGFEPQARTDPYGYFSYRPAFGGMDAIDYCAQGPQRHCLRVPDTAGQVRIRVEGGYDLSTGLPFAGSLSGLVSVTASDDRNVRAITPLSATSLSDATVDGDFWGRTDFSDLSVEDSIRAFHKHQSMVAVAASLRDAIGDGDLSTSRLVAALYSELAPVLGATSWWDLDVPALESVILEAGSRFAERDELMAEAQSLAELAETVVAVISSIESVKNDGGISELLTANPTQLTGVTRVLKAFLQLEYGPEADRLQDGDPLQWGWKQVFDADCGDGSPARIRIDRMRVALQEPDELSRDYCSTLGSGTFADLSATDASLAEGDESIELAFNEDGTLSLKLDGIIDDFDDGAEFGGFWSQPTDDQIIVTLTAFGGSFEETASINFLSEDGGEFEFEFRYLDEVSTFTTTDNPFE